MLVAHTLDSATSCAPRMLPSPSRAVDCVISYTARCGTQTTHIPGVASVDLHNTGSAGPYDADPVKVVALAHAAYPRLDRCRTCDRIRILA